MSRPRSFGEPLPIDPALPQLLAVLQEKKAAVLVAPPGAGKTTRVPLVIAEEPWAKGKKILVLEPRRLAARAAAERMAATIGEKVGESVGYRVRFGSQISRKTRIEVVTEGIFTRLVLDDPALEDVAAVLFDEFHERSLDADLGLAFSRDAQLGFCENLKILVMSATIDGARIAKLLGNAPVITTEGKSFPVETRYHGRDTRTPVERAVADAVTRALRIEAGSILAFLPGAAEIRRAEVLLRDQIGDPAVEIVPLYGNLDWAAQNQAITPARPGHRKVVLATSIAETSLTIEGVRIVIDSGLARVPRYEPDVALTRLETVRVSRAAADQRRGRAGRTGPGVCIRLWDEPQTAALEPFAKPEILAADLSGFMLYLAQWGVSDPGKLVFLDTPPSAALSEAKILLSGLGAIDAQGIITEEGRKLARLPLPPRLAGMVMDGSAEGVGLVAAEIAAVLSERGLGGDDVDLAHRLHALRRDRSRRGEDARRMAKRWTEQVAHPRTANNADLSIGAILSRAYPDRIAKNRGTGGAFLLANGRGAKIDPASSLAREPFLVIAELSGSAAQGRALLAAAISLAEIENRFAGRIESREEVTFDTTSLSLRGRRTRRLGALTLSDQPMKVTASEQAARALAEGIAQVGMDRLPWTKSLHQWRDRVMFLRGAESEEWPDLSDSALASRADEWLAPALLSKTAFSEFTADELHQAMSALLPWNLRRRLDADAPTHFTAPSGSSVPIDYQAPEGPKLSIRVQELFGLDRHPSIAGGKVALVLELLSPAHRPVQVTRDLPGFWRGSYSAVKAEMKGRYPKHPWPDNPLTAPATRRAKRFAKP